MATSRVSVSHFHAAAQRSSAIRDLVVGYVGLLIAQFEQATACNALHDLESRLCRWLLQAHDRADGNRLVRHDPDATTLDLGATQVRLDRATGAVSALRSYTFNGKRTAILLTIRSHAQRARAIATVGIGQPLAAAGTRPRAVARVGTISYRCINEQVHFASPCAQPPRPHGPRGALARARQTIID